MPGMFVINPCGQRAPVVLAGIAQIDLFALVAGHVHALVGKALIGDVLQTQLEFEEMSILTKGEAKRLIL